MAISVAFLNSNNLFAPDSGITQRQGSGLQIQANPRVENINHPLLPSIDRITYVYSFGLVGYRIKRNNNTNEIEFVLIQHKGNKQWCFPKGRFEPQLKESVFGYDTAKREFWEETGIESKQIEKCNFNFPFISHYCYINKKRFKKKEPTNENVVSKDTLIKKWTTLFVAKINNEAKPKIVSPKEIANVEWVNYDTAMKYLIHNSDKQIISNVYNFIHGKINKNQINYYLVEKMPQTVQNYNATKVRHLQQKLQSHSNSLNESKMPEMDQKSNNYSNNNNQNQNYHSINRIDANANYQQSNRWNSNGLSYNKPKISKTMCWLLRGHAYPKVKLKFSEDGYILVSDLLNCHQMRKLNVTMEIIEDIVNSDKKNRYSLISASSTNNSNNNHKNIFKIRCNQGHNFKVSNVIKSDSLLLPITLNNIENLHKQKRLNMTAILHGTQMEYYDAIIKNGLNRMNRTHIHFACDDNISNVKSGMRSNCTLLIYVDIVQCIKDGIKFYISSNNVVLSDGDKNGTIAPKYFTNIVKRR